MGYELDNLHATLPYIVTEALTNNDARPVHQMTALIKLRRSHWIRSDVNRCAVTP